MTTTTIPAEIADLIAAGKVTHEQWERFADAIRKEALPAGQRRGRNKVRLDKGFDAVVIRIEEDEGGWWVSGSGYYLTSHGPRVQGQYARHFPKERDARAYANDWVAEYLGEGMVINPHRDDIYPHRDDI